MFSKRELVDRAKASIVSSKEQRFRDPLCTSMFRGSQGFPGGSVVKNLPANAGDVREVSLILGQEDPLEEGTAIHSSLLAWRIPWTEEPGELWVAKSRTRLKRLTTHAIF